MSEAAWQVGWQSGTVSRYVVMMHGGVCTTQAGACYRDGQNLGLGARGRVPSGGEQAPSHPPPPRSRQQPVAPPCDTRGRPSACTRLPERPHPRAGTHGGRPTLAGPPPLPPRPPDPASPAQTHSMSLDVLLLLTLSTRSTNLLRRGIVARAGREAPRCGWVVGDLPDASVRD